MDDFNLKLLVENYENTIKELKELGLNDQQIQEELIKFFSKEEIEEVQRCISSNSNPSNNNQSSKISTASEMTIPFTIILNDIRKEHPKVYEALCSLSRQRCIYLGRKGYGRTKVYFKEQKEEGSVALLEKFKIQLTDMEYSILENMMVEGTIFANYNSLMEFLKEKKLLS